MHKFMHTNHKSGMDLNSGDQRLIVTHRRLLPESKDELK